MGGVEASSRKLRGIYARKNNEYRFISLGFNSTQSASELLQATALNLREEEQCTRVRTMPDRTTTTTPAVRGRPFAKGNGGRRPGSKNKNSLILASLSDGEQEELLRKGYELANAGNVPMLKLFLGRILPRERAIRIDLPQMQFADDAVEALGAILRAVSEGLIKPGEGADLANLVNSYARAIDIADLVRRIDTLEAKMMGRA
jgi:hypothetical protein